MVSSDIETRAEFGKLLESLQNMQYTLSHKLLEAELKWVVSALSTKMADLKKLATDVKLMAEKLQTGIGHCIDIIETKNPEDIEFLIKGMNVMKKRPVEIAEMVTAVEKLVTVVNEGRLWELVKRLEAVTRQEFDLLRMTDKDIRLLESVTAASQRLAKTFADFRDKLFIFRKHVDWLFDEVVKLSGNYPDIVKVQDARDALMETAKAVTEKAELLERQITDKKFEKELALLEKIGSGSGFDQKKKGRGKEKDRGLKEQPKDDDKSRTVQAVRNTEVAIIEKEKGKDKGPKKGTPEKGPGINK